MKNILLIISALFITAFSHAQCFDPDADIWKNTWESCSVSDNPKSEYGQTHWLMYNLGIERKLSKTWVWNSNDPDKLNTGFKTVKVDYSLDGGEWTYWGEMVFPQGTGEAIYSGFSGPDMTDIKAQYVLITVVDTYGSDCAGIAEIKFNLLPNYEYQEIPDEEEEEESACAQIEYSEAEVYGTEVFIFWELEEEIEVEEYVVFVRLEGDDEWTELVVGESEIFLEDLEEGVYEYKIDYWCEGEILESEIFAFTISGEEENEDDCTEITDVEIYPEEEAVYITWNGPEDVLYEVFMVQVDDEEEAYYETDETEIFIDGLEMDTEYEFGIGYACDDEWYETDVYFFTTKAMEPVTSVDDIQSSTQLTAAPNPFDQNLNLIYEGTRSELVNVYMFDISGKRIYAEQFKAESGRNDRQIVTSDLMGGTYIVQTVGLVSRATQSLKVLCVRR